MTFRFEARFLTATAEKSAELQRILIGARDEGPARVIVADIAALNRLAKQHGVRRWEHTRDERDYDELIALAWKLNPHS